MAGTHGLIRTLSSSSITGFKKAAISERHGVYVFSLKKPGNSAPRPWYVGLAKKQSFADEAMTDDKLRKYASSMFGRTGSPLITLVGAPKTGPRNAIDDLETLLIWIARARNQNLLNERKISSDPKHILALVNKLSIAGVLNRKKGKPSAVAKEFQRIMGLS